MSEERQADAIGASDPHPVWLDEWRALGRAYDLCIDDFREGAEPVEPALIQARLNALEGLMSVTPAATRRGAVAQLTWLSEATYGFRDNLGIRIPTKVIDRALSVLDDGLPAIDPHPVWLDRWRVAWDECCDIWGDIEGHDPVPERGRVLEAESRRLVKLIVTTQPLTMAGAAAQLRLFYEDASGLAYGEGNGEYDKALVESVLAFIEAKNFLRNRS